MSLLTNNPCVGFVMRLRLTLLGPSKGTDVIHCVIPFVKSDGDGSDYQIVVFPMSHLIMGASGGPTDQFGPNDTYDLVDLVIPINLKSNQMILFLSSLAHGGGAANQIPNLPPGCASRNFGKEYRNPKNRTFLGRISEGKLSDLSVHLDLVDFSQFESIGHCAALSIVDGVKQYSLEYMKEDDPNRQARVEVLLSKIQKNHSYLEKRMEGCGETVDFADSAYRMVGGTPAFLYHTESELKLISEALDHRPLREIKSVMASPTVSQAIGSLKDACGSLERNARRKSYRIKR